MTTLLDPLPFRQGVRAANRAWLAPLTNQQSHDDGTLSEDELRFLALRAEGGFGIVETCASHVAPDGQGWPGELGCFDDAHLPGLTELAHTLEQSGARGIAQLFHGGLRAPSKLIGQQAWSASAVQEPGAEAARAATDEDLARVIGQFRDAAVRAHAAGFSGVELHGAHGYLLCQFLSRTINQRRDAWGGDLPGRARLLRETLRAVRGAVPASFVVGVRLSPEDRGNARGLDLDESLTVARWLVEDGADFLHLSLWDASANTAKRPDAHPVPLFRAVIPQDVVLVAAGNVWTRADAEALLAKGADAVAVGRAAIVNPDWPRRVREGDGTSVQRPPVTESELRARGLNARFARYMRNWKGFVADESPPETERA